MTLHRDLEIGDRLQPSWVDKIQEFISTQYSPNFKLDLATSTTLRVQAGTDNAQVCVGINGRWRYITANVTAAVPGGLPTGVADVYVCASDNNFAGTDPEVDSTNYAFTLQIKATGATPSTALYRKIGTVRWTGTALTDVRLDRDITNGDTINGTLTVTGLTTLAAMVLTGGATVDTLTASGAITAASLSAAIDAANLTSGTVPLARLSNLTDTQIAAAAAIAWSKLSKAGSSLADLATRSASDLSSGTVPLARLSGITAAQAPGLPPVGALVDYAGSGDPADTNWLLADGRALVRATYPALFTAIATSFGAGNGTTTFNIPDKRGSVSVGPDDMGTPQGAAGRMATGNTLGARAGAETLALAITNLPAHTHGPGTLGTDTVAAHTHDATGLTLAAASGGTPTGTVAGSGILTTGSDNSDHTHSGTTANDTTDHHHTVPNANTSGTGWGLTGSVGSSSTTNTSGRSSAHAHTFTTGGRSTSHQHTLASHDHVFTGDLLADHTHGFSGTTGSGGAHSHAVTTGVTASVGSGTAFSVKQPYQVMNQIIRVT